MITTFPEFIPLSLDIRDEYDSIVNKFESYSDFNFVSLFTWDTLGQVKVSLLNNNLVIIINDYVTNEIRVSFIGTDEVAKTINELVDYCHTNHINDSLYLMPEVVVDALAPHEREAYIIEEDRDNHDYILLATDLAELRSSKYGSKKSWYNFFIKHNEGISSKIIDLTDPEVARDIERVTKVWQETQHRNDEDSENEFIAIERCMHYAGQLGVQGFGVYLDGKMIGFQIFEVTSHSTAIDHYEKADVTYKGIFEYIKCEAAKHLVEEHIDFINMEQDLGLPGLRQAKESYRPVKFLKNFSISPKH